MILAPECSQNAVWSRQPSPPVNRRDDAFQELMNLMRLEPLEVNLFRGVSRDIGTERVFGGQVLAQALLAASQTVEDRLAHSLHAYFLRAGDPDAAIVMTRDYLAYLREVMGAAVEEWIDFDEAYDEADWSRFENLPAFEEANRVNAYAVYLSMTNETLQ